MMRKFVNWLLNRKEERQTRPAPEGYIDREGYITAISPELYRAIALNALKTYI
jgi:hypothetical protein